MDGKLESNEKSASAENNFYKTSDHIPQEMQPQKRHWESVQVCL